MALTDIRIAADDGLTPDIADDRQKALRSNLMTKGLSMRSDLTSKQIGKAKGTKLVKRFGG